MKVFVFLGKIFAIILGILLILYLMDLSIPEETHTYGNYLDAVITENIDLRDIATSIISDCPHADTDCQINEIYRNVVENYKYYGDPRANEFIQDPFETIKVKGGDCEDLAILISSLLENIGIKTYLVFTENHAYGLACGVDLAHLQEEIVDSMNEEANIRDETISVPARSARYYGGDGTEAEYPFEIKYEVSSDKAINVHVVPSQISLDLWSRGKSYKYYAECSSNKIYRTSSSCDIDYNGGIMVINENSRDAIVDLKLDINYLILDMEEFLTTYYTLNDEICIVLDAASGKYGYPGHISEEITGNKTAVDPVTWEEIYLN